MKLVETIDMANRLYSVHRLQIKKLGRDVDFMYKDFIPKFFREMIARLGGQ